MNTELFKDGGWIQGGGIRQSAVTLWNYCGATKRRKNAFLAAIDVRSIGNLLKEIAMGYMVIVGQDI